MPCTLDFSFRITWEKKIPSPWLPLDILTDFVRHEPGQVNFLLLQGMLNTEFFPPCAPGAGRGAFWSVGASEEPVPVTAVGKMSPSGEARTRSQGAGLGPSRFLPSGPGEGAADTLLRSELPARGPSHLEARVPLNRGWNPREYSPLSPRALPASTHPKCHGQNLSSLFQNAPSFL